MVVEELVLNAPEAIEGDAAYARVVPADSIKRTREEAVKTNVEWTRIIMAQEDTKKTHAGRLIICARSLQKKPLEGRLLKDNGF